MRTRKHATDIWYLNISMVYSQYRGSRYENKTFSRSALLHTSWGSYTMGSFFNWYNYGSGKFFHKYWNAASVSPSPNPIWMWRTVPYTLEPFPLWKRRCCGSHWYLCRVRGSRSLVALDRAWPGCAGTRDIDCHLIGGNQIGTVRHLQPWLWPPVGKVIRVTRTASEV